MTGVSTARARPEAASRARRPERRKRLLIVGGFPESEGHVKGGIVTDCQALMRSRIPEEYEIIPLDSTQRTVPPPGFVRRGVDAAGRAFAFYRKFRSFRPDAIMVFASSGPSPVEKGLYCWYAKARGVPSLLLLRGGAFMEHCRRSPVYRLVAKVALSGATRLPCQGKTWQDFFSSVLGFSPQRCPVVSNWTASETYFSMAEERRYLNDGPLSLLFVGWMEPAKGIVELLDAMRIVVEAKTAPVKLTLAGEGSLLAGMDQRLRERGIQDVVECAGWVSGEEKAELFRRADCLVLPSHVEGLPNSIVEAAASGLPVVTTPVGSIPDVITDDINGLLVDVGDAAGLAAAILRLAEDPALRERIGRAAHVTATSEFSLEVGAERLLESLAEAGA